MHIEFTASRDRAYARRLVRRTARRQLIGIGYLAFAFAFFGAASVSTGADLAVLSGLGSLALAACLAFGLWRGVRRTVRRLPREWFEPRSYQITDDRISWESAHSGSHVSWTMVERLQEVPFAFLLWHKGGLLAWDLPLAALTEGQREEFRQFVHRRTAPPSPPEEAVVVSEAGSSRLRPPAPGGH